MNLHTLEIVAIYSSLGVYGLGAFGFFLFSLSYLLGRGSRVKGFLLGTLLTPVWPLFIVGSLIKQHKVAKRASKGVSYINVGL